MALDDKRAALDELRTVGLFRETRLTESGQGPRVMLDSREVELLCSEVPSPASPVVASAR